MIHAASQCDVEAVGITLSPAQADEANARIEEAALADKAAVYVQDYRDIPDEQAYDAVVSVGMFEHVGSARLLLRQIWCLAAWS